MLSQRINMSYIEGDTISSETPNFESIGDFLKYFTDKRCNEDAVVFRSKNGPRVAVSWKEMCEKSYKMARTFVSLGVRPGECVALVTRTCPEWLYVTFGAMLAGACVAGMVFTYKGGSDVIALIEKIDNCSLIVLDPGVNDENWNILKRLMGHFAEDGTASSDKLPFLRYLLFIQRPEDESVVTLQQLLEQDSTKAKLPKSNPDDIAFLFQTSGSTGVPKLIAHTLCSLLNLNRVLRIDHFTENDIFFYERSFSWSGGFPIGLFIGQTRVTYSGFCSEPEDRVAFLRHVIQEERCTVAAMFVDTINELETRHAELQADWPLEAILIGGQPVTKSISSCIGRVCRRVILEYGCTEFHIGITASLKHPELVEDYLAGKPLPGNEFKVIDKDGNTVPIGERGELCMRGPCLFKEYLNDKEKTRKAMTEDGWYKTDDIGRISKDGVVYVEGRMSDVIISGSTNMIMPSILESALMSAPNVKNVVVVPVSDMIMYQVVCACVQVGTRSNVVEAELRDFLADIHNDKKGDFTVLPKYYLIMEEFPKGRTGKVSRLQLKKMAELKFGTRTRKF